MLTYFNYKSKGRWAENVIIKMIYLLILIENIFTILIIFIAIFFQPHNKKWQALRYRCWYNTSKNNICQVQGLLGEDMLAQGKKWHKKNKTVNVRNVLYKAIYCFKCIDKLKVSMVSLTGCNSKKQSKL